MTRTTILWTLVLLGAAACAVPVTLQVDKTAVTEGDAVLCTVTRPDTAGALTVQYAAGQPLAPVAEVKASSYWGGMTPACAIDDSLSSQWMNAGNSKAEGKDDAPWIAFTFAQVYTLNDMQIANFVHPGETQRAPKEVQVEIADDGVTFIPHGIITLRRPPAGTVSVFETFPLEGINAKAVRLRILSNYANKVFGKGTSDDGDYANNSYVGLAEVAFHVAGAGPERLSPLPGRVVIPDGQASVSFTLQTIDDQWLNGTQPLQVRLLAGDGYTPGTPDSALVTIADNDTGDEVSIAATTPRAVRAGQKPGVFTITRKSTRGNLTVQYATATLPVPVLAVSASDHHYGGPPANAIDGNLQTNWMNTGNADRESEGVDDPWIVFTFDKVYPLGQLRVANYVQRGHTFRGVQTADILVATDMAHFTMAATHTFAQLPDNATVSAFQRVDLNGVLARRVALRIRSNFAKTFGKRESYEGPFANGSIVGLSEVQFLTGSSAGKADYQETLTSSVTIPDGKSSVTLTITPTVNKSPGEKTVVLTLLPDNITYTVTDARQATVTIVAK